MCKSSDIIKNGTEAEAHQEIFNYLKEQGETIKKMGKTLDSIDQKFSLMEKGNLTLPKCQQHEDDLKELGSKIENRTYGFMVALIITLIGGIAGHIIRS